MPSRLKQLIIDRVDLVDKGANPDARIVLFKRDEEVAKAEWTQAFINNLPDSSFAVIEPGGEKDEEGKTKPRSLRHLPYKDAEGNIDSPHLRNALSRLPQTNLSEALKNKARAVLERAAKEAGVGEKAEKRFRERFEEAIAKADVPLTFSERLSAERAREGWWRSQSSLEDTLRSIQESSVDNKMELARQAVAEFTEHVLMMIPAMWPGIAKAKAPLLEIADLADSVEKQGRVLSDANMKRLMQAMQAMREVLDAAGTEKTQKGRGSMPTLEEVLKALPDEQRAVVEEAVQKKEPPKPDDVNKADLPEPLRKRFEEMEKRAEEAERLAKAEREAREWEGFQKRAESLPHVGERDKVAEILKAAYGVSKENGEALEATLKAANEQIEKGRLFDEMGRDGNRGQSDAMTAVNKRAEEIRKADPALTEAQAFDKALQENPAAYAEYLKEAR